jgi:predicted adenylyl cyclase CyaB
MNLEHNYVGVDHQIDTYFKTTKGRFKLRESSLSGPYLIFYLREDLNGPKTSVYQKLPVEDPKGFKILLEKMQGIHAVIEKKREIFIYDNVRIHLDDVFDLGSFLEFEAVMDETYHDRELEIKKVEFLMKRLSINDDDLVRESYENLIGKM